MKAVNIINGEKSSFLTNFAVFQDLILLICCHFLTFGINPFCTLSGHILSPPDRGHPYEGLVAQIERTSTRDASASLQWHSAPADSFLDGLGMTNKESHIKFKSSI